MYHNLAILRMAGQMAGNAALRQSAVAQNVANADTPGYHRKTMSFAAAMGSMPAKAP